jgi:hypothetical protein
MDLSSWLARLGSNFPADSGREEDPVLKQLMRCAYIFILNNAPF